MVHVPQFQQAIQNPAVNARDATPRGGSLPADTGGMDREGTP
jgi:hypothetical protein